MDNSEDKFTMVYRYLGNTGLKVSLIAFGTMLVDYSEESQQSWIKCAKLAFEAGVNYFDSAEVYGFGEGDKLLGRAIRENGWKREDIIVSIKMFNGFTPTTSGLSRKKIIESTLNSLKNMGLDYCDLVFAHRWETETPLEETCKAFNWLIKKGYLLYWATSTWPEEMVMEAIKICDRKGWHRPVSEQCEYNCLIREHVETSYRRIIEKYGFGTTVWSPLGGGILTGKYNEGTLPEGSRYKEEASFRNFAWEKYMGPSVIEKSKKMFREIKELAESMGATQAQLALAWVLVNKDVSSCIIGASRISQLESNLKALEIAANWTEELEARMNEILGNQPTPPINYLKFQPYPPRRQIRLDIGMELGKVEYRDKDHTDYD